MKSIAVAIALTLSFAVHGSNPHPPNPIAEFALKDFAGKEVRLGNFADKSTVVVLFLGTDCPLVKLYGDRLATLEQEYSKNGVAFIGIDSNIQDSNEDLARFASQCGIRFPLLKDPEHTVADLFTARRTPEVFLLDQGRHIRYRGRIDDQFGVQSQGAYRRSATVREDLKIALDELLAGREISVARTDATGCVIGRRPEPNESSKVTWSNAIAGIVQRHCQECHRPGEVAPFSMLEYEEVLGWGETIAEVVNEGRMPPWHASPEYGHFKNDSHVSESDKKLILEWVANGTPRGNPADAPPPKVFEKGWQIPKPDKVYWMSEKPYVLPANGSVQYQYFTVDPGFDEGKWVRAVESRPSNPAVVHHINVFVLSPEKGDTYHRDDLTNHLISAYAPGLRTTPFPEGSAYYVPAGSKFVFQLHYSPIGSVQEDHSFMGVIFAKPEEVQERVEVALAVNDRFTIPPNDGNYRVTSFYEYGRDTTMFAISPHMHLRGRAFRFEAFYPDGKREILLDIPRYDFNWQTIYELAEPKLIPRGTIVECNAVYDNSKENLANPDPSVPVRWGDQTFEEMMIGYMFVRLPKDATLDTPPAVAAETSGLPNIVVGSVVIAGLGALLFAMWLLRGKTTAAALRT